MMLSINDAAHSHKSVSLIGQGTIVQPVVITSVAFLGREQGADREAPVHSNQMVHRVLGFCGVCSCALLATSNFVGAVLAV